MFLLCFLIAMWLFHLRDRTCLSVVCELKPCVGINGATLPVLIHVFIVLVTIWIAMLNFMTAILN